MPKVIDISVKELAETLKKENLLQIHRNEVKAEVYDACLKSVNDFVEVSPVDTGLYANSWDMEENKDNVFFGNTAPYAYDIEYGTKPYNADYRSLLEWAGRKLQLPTTSPEVQNLAHRAWYKIKTQGLDPHYILTKGIDDTLIPNIIENINKMTTRDDLYDKRNKDTKNRST